VPWEHLREQADIGDEAAGGVVLGALAELAVAEPERAGVADVGQRRSETSIAVSVALMLGGMAAQAVGVGERPAVRLRGIFVAARAWPVPGAAAATCEQRRHDSAQLSGFMACHSPGRSLPSGMQSPAWPSAAAQIRKTCTGRPYRPPVPESDRTQASRTMNAEPAQIVTDHVN
jgi:predicted CxxxxCH...CXXCH cytochrome family protein